MRLLTSNLKLQKSPGISEAWRIIGLTLSPHKSSGRQVCSMATSCVKHCVLEHVGHSVIPNVVAARQRKTDLFFDNRELFFQYWVDDLTDHVRQCHKANERPGCRNNVASDLKWEKLFPELFSQFPALTFYDYTKHPGRTTPDNYHLTYSVSERDRTNNNKHIVNYLETGRNVSIVCDATYNPAHGIIAPVQKSITINGKRYKTVDGDKHDLRIPQVDGRGKVVLLRYKGSVASRQKAIESGFCWQLAN